MASAVRLHSLVTGQNGAVDSGGAVELLLNGAVEDAELMKQEMIVLRVRSAVSGQVVFATSIDRGGVTELPTGNFRLRIGLEMNVRPGTYTFQPYVVTRQTGKDISAGPIVYVQVKEDPGFFGTVQLNPKMNVEPS